MDEGKKKALEEAMKTIEKSYGKGAAMRLGDKPPVQMESTSTGSMLLDEALGIGGYPKGRIIEIYGPESSGKCLVPQTKILTPTGYKTITEIFKENGLDTVNTKKEVEVNYPLINKNGDIEETTHFVFNGKREVFETKTKTGRIINSTAKHPLCVIDENGLIVWRYTYQLKAGDVLVGRKGNMCFPETNLISEDEATLIGMFVADAHFAEKRLSFTNNSKEIKEFYEKNVLNIEEFKELTHKSYKQANYESSQSMEYHLNSLEKVSGFYERIGIKTGTAKDKSVPPVILNSGKEVQIAFLKGYFDCECHISDVNLNIEVMSASYQLLDEIQLMLNNLGIVSFLSEKIVKGCEQNHYYRLDIYSHNVLKFNDLIGFISKSRKETMSKCLNGNSYNWEERIPNIEKLVVSYCNSLNKSDKSGKWCDWLNDIVTKPIQVAKDKLEALLETDSPNKQLKDLLLTYLDDNLYFDPVLSIEKKAAVPTFDFAMSTTHTFIAEGIINHNTTLTLHAIAEAQKKNGVCAFIDAEHALDPKYAKNLGVDTENLIVSQPDTGEQALEICEAFVRSGAVDLVVIDSVAALVPRAEIEGDMGQSHVGLQARLMSQALRKLAGVIHKTNTTVIFINQIREKVGVMFGSPETTSGGRALKFYASVRLDIRKRETLKDGTDMIGSKTKVKVVKNKVSPPFKEVEFDIMFGLGIDTYGEVVDLGVTKGIVDKAGSWFSYKGEKLGQGRENVKTYFKDNDEIYQEIRKEILEGKVHQKKEDPKKAK